MFLSNLLSFKQSTQVPHNYTVNAYLKTTVFVGGSPQLLKREKANPAELDGDGRDNKV